MNKKILYFMCLISLALTLPAYAATGETEGWGWDTYLSEVNSYVREEMTNNYVTENYYEESGVERNENETYNSTTISVGIGQSYIYRNGVIVQMDAPAFTNSASYTMVPLRAIAECLDGAEVAWDSDSKTASVYYKGDVIKMSAVSRYIEVNEDGFWGKTTPETRNGRIFIPMRDLATAFGLPSENIEWNAQTKTATFYFK